MQQHRHTEPFFVLVITTKRDDPNNVYDNRKINWHSDTARRWFKKHQHWAMYNGLAVHTAAA
jgi:hypothetical protein